MTFIRPLDKIILDLFDTGRHFRHHKGDVILRETDGLTVLHLINSGYVKAYTLNEDGQESIVEIFKAGEIFPITWTMSEEMRTIFYEAIGPVSTHRISLETLYVELRRPGTQLPLTFLSYAADQISMLTDRLDNLQYTSAHQRVAYRIYFLANRFGKKVKSGVRIEIPLTQQDIANSVNLSRETTSRVIEKLVSAKLIAYDSHRLVVKDADGLKAELNPETRTK